MERKSRDRGRDSSGLKPDLKVIRVINANPEYSVRDIEKKASVTKKSKRDMAKRHTGSRNLLEEQQFSEGQNVVENFYEKSFKEIKSAL